MRISICKNDGEVFAIHDVDEWQAQNIIHVLQQSLDFRPMTHAGEVEPPDVNGADVSAHDILSDLITACSQRAVGVGA